MPFSYGEAEISLPSIAKLRTQPPFAIQYLKGLPVFWDDFEHGLGGVIPHENDSTALGTAGYKQNDRWTYNDGNDYSVYVTSEAAHTGSRSLRLGRTSSAAWTAEAAIQDASVSLSVPSGIVGVECSIYLANLELTTGSYWQVSIEHALAGNTHSEMLYHLLPTNNNNPFIEVVTPTGNITVLSTSVQDDLGRAFTASPLTGGMGTTDINRGHRAAWHRTAFICDMNTEKFLDIYLDKFHVSTAIRALGINQGFPHAAGYTMYQEGVYRIEAHSVANGASFMPVIYMDDVVVTDEGL